MAIGYFYNTRHNEMAARAMRTNRVRHVPQLERALEIALADWCRTGRQEALKTQRPGGQEI